MTRINLRANARVFGWCPNYLSMDATVASSSASGGQSTKGGFKDQGVETKPVGNQGVVYPTALYVDKADTNLLSQESIDTHPSNTAKTTLEADWNTASGTATQPASTQSNAKYPFNHVLETESGHYIEFDDTKDNERIHIFHKTGTFIEIDPTGNVVIKTVGNVTNIVAGNMDTHVVGNYSLSVGGNMDVYAVGNLTEKVDGNRKTTITGTETLAITGATTNEYAAAVTNTLKDALTEEITGDVTQTLSATLTANITGAAAIKSSAAMTVGGSTISFN